MEVTIVDIGDHDAHRADEAAHMLPKVCVRVCIPG